MTNTIHSVRNYEVFRRRIFVGFHNIYSFPILIYLPFVDAIATHSEDEGSDFTVEKQKKTLFDQSRNCEKGCRHKRELIELKKDISSSKNSLPSPHPTSFQKHTTVALNKQVRFIILLQDVVLTKMHRALCC